MFICLGSIYFSLTRIFPEADPVVPSPLLQNALPHMFKLPKYSGHSWTLSSVMLNPVLYVLIAL